MGKNDETKLLGLPHMFLIIHDPFPVGSSPLQQVMKIPCAGHSHVILPPKELGKKRPFIPRFGACQGFCGGRKSLSY